MLTNHVTVKDKPFTTFIDTQTLQKRVSELGQTITKDFEGQQPIFLAVLNGAFIFAADLVRAVAIPELTISFVRYKSYEGFSSTGEIRTILPIPPEVKGRPVIVVEDIVDTGRTMQQIKKDLKEAGATQVKIASLLLKPDALEIPISIDYLGFEIESRFVVGYGLDYDGYGRHLPDLMVLNE